MKTELRQKLIKLVSFKIGLCGSVKPEKQAEAAVDEILLDHDITPKLEQNNG